MATPTLDAGYVPSTITGTELDTAVSRIAAFIRESTTPERSDRLWPGDYLMFLTTSLSLAYGASGTAVFLRDVDGTLPDGATEWMLRQNPTAADCAPSLYTGIAGFSYALAELGLIERAIEVFDGVRRSPLRLANPSMFHGMAGWGTAALHLYARTHLQPFLDDACMAADHLVATGERVEDCVFWTSDAERPVPLGMGFGASGIALFLLNMWLATGHERYRDVAEAALAFDIKQARTVGESLVWGVEVDASLHTPYWLRGTAGIGAVLIRFYEHLRAPEYLAIAKGAARGAYALFTAASGQFEGASGLGEYFVDLYRITEDAVDLERAKQIAESVLCFGVDCPGGLAFPGRGLHRLTTDFATGSAGIGAFLLRVAHPGPRRLHDVVVL